LDKDATVDELTQRFEEHRGHLRAVAYRMLGSLSEADDAVQESWLRLSRTDVSAVENLRGWLTTVVGRICLDMLRSRTARREDPLDVHLPDPIVSPAGGSDPEQQALVADSIGLALLVVLDTLTPAERLALVLHDMFAVPFEDIGRIVGRSSAATKQLASRARRRVRGSTPTPDADPARERQIVEAFLAASRAGDFEALLVVLDPDVVLRADAGVRTDLSALVRGAAEVAGRALMFRRLAYEQRIVSVNGGIGVLSLADGRPASLVAITVADGRIVEIDILADPARLARLAVPT
jgi:RNA polymerase sigma-70 factor (ECF subfamily)